mgnify:FL=1
MTRELQGSFRVHIVDDDDGVRRALGRLLKSTGLDVQAHSSGEELLADFAPQIPACAIVDMYLPKMNGFELKRKISALSPRLPVIFLTGRGDIGMGVAAMKEGAFDFLTKPVEPEQFLAVIAAAKEHVAESESCSRDAARYEERLKNLTPREAEVMDAVVAGDLNKQIAHDLGLAEKTVKVHRARVMKKMGVRSVAELVRVSVTKRIDLS